MPWFYQWTGVLWALGLAAVFVAAVWLVVANAWYRGATGDRIPATDLRPGPIGTLDEYPEGLGEAHGRVTMFLKVYIVAFIVWSIGYIYIFVTSQP